MGFHNALDKYFQISARGSTLAVEIRAGLATFLTIAYIMAVNPQILSAGGLEQSEVFTATCLSSIIASAGLGLFANLPFAISPGMGMNAYLAFNQVLGAHATPEQALATVLVAAVIVAFLAIVRALSVIMHLVPNTVKLATVLGMGLLLSLIGMHECGIVVPDPQTMVGMGNLLTPEAIVAGVGLALITVLLSKNVKGSILIGIAAAAIALWTVRGDWPTAFFAVPKLRIYTPDFSKILAGNGGALSAILAYTLVMVFDIGGALFGLGSLAGLQEGGKVAGSVAAYLSAAAGSVIGAILGTTPLIISAESAVGIKEGGRTGLVGLVVAACFVISLPIAPLLQALPAEATAPVLVLVGAMMMSEAANLDWTDMKVAVPAFLTMAVQPFTFSISNGIYVGLAFSVMLWILTGDFLDTFRLWGESLKRASQQTGGGTGAAEGAMADGLETLLDTTEQATGHHAHVHVPESLLPNFVRYSEVMGSPPMRGGMLSHVASRDRSARGGTAGLNQEPSL
ncbi:hypothetical protein FOA52_009347 [Chlamydomonas sp. UWO 241]|nr:hypothetical protein FOA52_009347 [Chlamydomonas sp. UWO 241]